RREGNEAKLGAGLLLHGSIVPQSAGSYGVPGRRVTARRSLSPAGCTRARRRRHVPSPLRIDGHPARVGRSALRHPLATPSAVAGGHLRHAGGDVRPLPGAHARGRAVVGPLADVPPGPSALSTAAAGTSRPEDTRAGPGFAGGGPFRGEAPDTLGANTPSSKMPARELGP